MAKDDNKKAPINKEEAEAPAVQEELAQSQRPSAINLLRTFLTENNIELTTSPFEKNIKYVSDGSVIVSTPTISARYTNERKSS